MKKLNLDIYMDLLGNIFGQRKGSETNLPPILMGSHLDSVEMGVNMMGIGAGHDTISMVELTDCAMVFVPSKSGRSHSPDEYTDPKHIAHGSNIILDTVLELVEMII